MTDSAIAARIVNALEAAADREVGAPTALVSVTLDVLKRADAGAIAISVTRKTRTLVFMTAEFRNDGGERIVSASSVHKVL